ncbi:MAG: galactokinase family protein [Eubacteriales bacterium]|nr:galactokinase family protein [Eubacteriales bacterium]
MNVPDVFSTPSRLCLFGEHQDYLGLEVVAVAIDLRFSARVVKQPVPVIHIAIRDSKLDRLDSVNDANQYEFLAIDLNEPIRYTSKRDYLRSSVRVLQKHGYPLTGLDIRMDSQIPIGKGMCSSSTMIVVLIKAILSSIGSPDSEDPRKIAELAFQAEVTEFDEPGGRMDHYTSALGGMVHLDFGGDFKITPLSSRLDGCLILFDSLEQKNTTQVLAAAKVPTQEALALLTSDGIRSVRDFFRPDGTRDEVRLALLAKLDPARRRALDANIDNYALLKRGLAMLQEETIDNRRLGELLSAHHARLRDGLGISTPTLEKILDTALAHGAWGGKVNGSGGGGCCFVYADPADAPAIMAAVEQLGYPSRLLRQDSGVRRDA